MLAVVYQAVHLSGKLSSPGHVSALSYLWQRSPLADMLMTL